MSKRTILICGPEDSGKSTMAASLLAPIPRPDKDGQPQEPLSPRWPRVDWYNLDKPGIGSIAWAFAPGSGARLIEVPAGDLDKMAIELDASARRAEAGEIDAIVVEGLSVYYSDDVGLEALAHPDAVAAGDNDMRGLYRKPRLRLQAILGGLRQGLVRAKNPNFAVVLTAHAKEIGDGTPKNPRRLWPDMSRNVWKLFVRLSDVVIQLERPQRQAPRITYSREEDKLLLARINDGDALAYFDDIHARRDEDKIARMRTIPGLVSLLEAVERKKQRVATAPAAQKTSET